MGKINPFIITGFEGPKYFCNRANELKKLKEAFDGKRNITLFSIRRMGKSALIKYHFEKISNTAESIYIDIFPVQDLKEFTEMIANKVTEQYGKSAKDYLTKIGAFIKSIGAVLSINELSGNPEITFGFQGIKSPQKSLEEILNHLNKTLSSHLNLALQEFLLLPIYIA